MLWSVFHLTFYSSFTYILLHLTIYSSGINIFLHLAILLHLAIYSSGISTLLHFQLLFTMASSIITKIIYCLTCKWYFSRWSFRSAADCADSIAFLLCISMACCLMASSFSMATRLDCKSRSFSSSFRTTWNHIYRCIELKSIPLGLVKRSIWHDMLELLI